MPKKTTPAEMLVKVERTYKKFDKRMRSIETQINDLLKVMIAKKDVGQRAALLKKINKHN
jgi:hypothetical protein